MDKERIQRVKDRLFLYDKISDLKESFRGHDYTEHPSKSTFDHKYRHYEALRFYLLLTCFDILGQGAEFVDFSKFLNGKDFKEERKIVINSLRTVDDIEDKIKAVHEYYLKTYGFKTRYLYFINNVLDQGQRDRLYASIKISKITNAFSANVKSEDIASVNRKNEFLFKLRNEFTHEGKSWASGSAGLFDDMASMWSDGSITWAFQPQYLEKKGSYHIQYSTLRWPGEVRKILQVTVERLRSQYN
jgi:hypothetical protein